jgi:L-fuconolactonase
VRRVDAHHHVWDLSRRPQPWTDGLPALRRSFGLDELRPELEEAGVNGTVVVQTVASLEETRELLHLAAGSAPVRGVVGWFDLPSPALPETLAAVRAGGGGAFLVGARHQLQEEPDPGWLRRADVRAGLDVLAAAGLVFDVVVSPHQLALVADTVAALDGVRFVLDHAGKPPLASGDLAQWRRDLERLSRSPNVAVKLSGLVTEADWSAWTTVQLRPVAEAALEAFGPDRTMFGSDWPVCLLAASYAEVVAVADDLLAGLDEAERAQVWSGTAERWYGLEPR